MGMKTGANFQDVNNIKKFAAAGKNAGQISKFLSIEVEVVCNFMPKAEVDEDLGDLEDLEGLDDEPLVIDDD